LGAFHKGDMMNKRFTLLLTMLMLLVSSSFAQTLESLAPADTIVSLGFSSESEFIQTLDDDLHALNWMSASDTLTKLADVLMSTGEFRDLADMLDMMNEANDGQSEMMDELYAVCPSVEGLMPKFEDVNGHVPFDALLSVGMSSFNPLPSVTAILELDGSYAPLMVELRETLLACALESGELEVSTLEQDGVLLYVLGDASDLPVVIGSMNEFFFAGTNPESLRGIIRKLNGGSDASFADGRLAQEMMTRFDQTNNDLSFSVDLAQLADLAEGFAGFVIDGPETEYLVNRGLAMLRTLGGVAGQITASPEGLISEAIWTINPDGGDPALADYVLCDTCNVSSPFLAASGAVTVSSVHIPWRELYAYAETWTNDLEVITGENIDIKQALAEELGFDLDTALFNWLGSDFHTVVLEPLSTDINTLFYGQQQYTFVPVSSVDAAKAGIAELQESLFPVIYELMGEMGTPNDFADAFSMGMSGIPSEGMIAVRPYDYKGTEINRVQFSINSDIGYAFVGNYLVLGSTAKAVETAVDTFMGGRTVMSDALYTNVRNRADVPQNTTSFAVSEDQTSVYALGNLLEGMSQPLAFTVMTGLEASLYNDYDDFFYDEFDFDDDYVEPYYADIFGIEPDVAAPGTTEGVIEEDEFDNLGYLTDFYLLSDLQVGDEVTITVSSEDFDTYIWLIDAFSEEYLDENDDSMNGIMESELSFTVEDFSEYWIEISSYEGDGTGTYNLTVDVTAASDMMTDSTTDDMSDTADMSDMDDMDMQAETPSFAELLDLFDLVPASLNVIADHLSTSESFSTIDGNTVYSRSITRIRW